MGWISRSTTIPPVPATWPPENSTAWRIPRFRRWWQPVTGQPLPWVSWGGTSQVFTALTFGLLLSVSSETDQEAQREVENNFSPDGVLADEDIVLTKD